MKAYVNLKGGTFEGDSREDIHQQVLDYLADVVFLRDLEAFDIVISNQETVTRVADPNDYPEWQL